jgi:hypothetical protein
LIAQGRNYYHEALKDPETAGRRALPGDPVECEAIAYVASKVYEARYPDLDYYDQIDRVQRDEPKGAAWEEDELAGMFPKLTRKFGQV